MNCFHLPTKLQSLLAQNAKQADQLSPACLAYIGDVVYELYIRSYYLLPARRIRDYHQTVVNQVRAETQANYLADLEPHLTELEKNIVKRGRNGANNPPKRLSPSTYRQATSLEALIGYLYLKNPERLYQLLEKLNLPNQ